MTVITLPSLLAMCVSTLLREGRADEVDEAIRQGRAVAEKSGPYPAGEPEDQPGDDGLVIRQAVLADAGLFGSDAMNSVEPIKLGGRS